MTKRKRTALVLLLLAAPAIQAPAQTNTSASTAVPITHNAPQWVKDLRRWEIVTFGSIPFTMFTATFAMDMYRWSQANGLDFSDSVRRYAPWPLKSAGAIAMESREMEQTVTIAAGLSIAIGVADFAIVQMKRYRARKRAEALHVGTAIITRSPWGDSDSPEDPGNAAGDEAPEPEQAPAGGLPGTAP